MPHLNLARAVFSCGDNDATLGPGLRIHSIISPEHELLAWARRRTEIGGVQGFRPVRAFLSERINPLFLEMVVRQLAARQILPGFDRTRVAKRSLKTLKGDVFTSLRHYFQEIVQYWTEVFPGKWHSKRESESALVRRG
jgi:hypothetical protein